MCAYSQMLSDDLYLRILLKGFEDARDIAKVRGVCMGFNEAAKNVTSIRYVCREKDHEKARRTKTIASTPSQSDKVEASERDSDENILEDVTTQRDAEVSEIDDKEYDSHDGKLPEIGNEDIPGKSGDGIPSFKSIGKLVEGSQQELLFRQAVEQDFLTKSRKHQRMRMIDDKEYDSHDGKLRKIGNEDIPGKSGDGIPSFKSIGKLVEGSQQELLFRQAVEQDLLTKSRIHQLQIEIESKLQSKSVGADEREHSDFWLSDPDHLYNWVPSVAQTLQHLCIVDYGNQAIVRVSPILKILSQCCKFLHLLLLYSFYCISKSFELLM